MRAIRVMVVSSSSFDSEPLLRTALNRIWSRFGQGQRKVDFTFRSTWRDADIVESGSQRAVQLLEQAQHRWSWIGEIHLMNMLELKGTRTREWMSIESPDVVLVLEHSKHDEFLDAYKKWARDFGATLIQVNQD